MRAVCEVLEPPAMPSWTSGAGRPSSAKNTADSSSSKCWPVCTSSSSPTSAQARRDGRRLDELRAVADDRQDLQRRDHVSASRTITAAAAAMSCSEAHSRTEWYSWPPSKMFGVGRPICGEPRAVGAAADRFAQRLDALRPHRLLGGRHDLGIAFEVLAHVGVLPDHLEVELCARGCLRRPARRRVRSSSTCDSSSASSKSRTIKRTSA